jgi:hypothetical protein
MDQVESRGNERKYKVWFLAGAETRDDRFNKFTGSFIRLMKEILNEDFDYIKGVFFNSNLANVIWALNNAQKPILYPANDRIISGAFMQIISKGYDRDRQIIIISSSSGSIVAAQLSHFIASKNSKKTYFTEPFHLVLGSSMIASKSELYRNLIQFQNEGIIGTIVHDEIQDDDDNTRGIGGVTRFEAYRNALGVAFPYLSRRYRRPSFLNTHPVNGHIHRKRSMSLDKAIDYIDIILVRHKLAGQRNSEKALELLEKIREEERGKTT